MSVFKPRTSDIAWAQLLMAKLHDGGLVRFPGPDLIYRKQGTNLVLVQGKEKNEIHQRTVAVFTAAGFAVVVKREPYEAVMAELRSAMTMPGSAGLIGPGALEDAQRFLTRHEGN